jgi:hypothetical protein
MTDSQLRRCRAIPAGFLQRLQDQLALDVLQIILKVVDPGKIGDAALDRAITFAEA